MMKRTRIMDRRALFASGAAAALLAATGVTAGAVPQRGGKLRMALSGGARSDGWLNGGGLMMQVARQGVVFETLTEIAADGTLRGELATGWDSNADGTQWVFDLRARVNFHAGQAFGARDVVYSLRQRGIHAKALGALRVAILLKEPMADLPFILAGPEHIIEPFDGSGAEGNGTGLYRVVRFDPGRQVLADRVEAHYRDGQAGWFDRVELVSLPSEDVRIQALGEYLVNAADVTEGDKLRAFTDHSLIEGVAISNDIGLPFRVGARWAVDNLRAPERWWLREGL